MGSTGDVGSGEEGVWSCGGKGWQEGSLIGTMS